MKTFQYRFCTCFFFLFWGFVFQINAQNIARANHPGPGPYGAQVNTYNGNLYLDRTDLILPNQGLPISLSFSYNSFRDTLDLGYGDGWLFTYGMMYGSWSSGAFIDHPDGRRDSFKLTQGVYRSPRGIFDVLTQPSPDRFLLSTKQGMKYYFEEASHKKLTKIEDPNGNTIRLTYSNGQLTSLTDASNRRVSLTWTGGRLTQVNDANFRTPRRISYTYDALGRLIRVTDPLNNTIVYTYDPNLGLMTQITNERSDLLNIGYNEAGQANQLSTCIAQTKFSYNPGLNKTYVLEAHPKGDHITTYAYDAQGRLIKKTGSCCGYNTQYEYDNDQNVNQALDANGNTLRMSHDDKGNPVQMTDPLGNKQAFAFEASMNRPISIKDKKGMETKMRYDAKGNLLTLTQALGVTTDFTYDTRGNMTGIKDGNGNQVRMVYNANNDVTTLRDAYGEENFTYDGANNLNTTTDANGNTFSFNYDALNRLISAVDPLNNQLQYEYDEASNLKREIDPNGNARAYGYDEHNRLNEVTTPAGKTRYNYDAVDNLTSLLDANGHSNQFDYNDRNLLLEERDGMGFKTKYDYDGNGNVVTKIDANGNSAIYSYDALNRLTRKTYLGNTDNYEYDENNNLINASNNEISISFRYDALNRLIEKTVNNWGKSIRYEYDKAGNRTKMIDPNGGTTTYTWDLNNRLTQITNPRNETTSFTYDNAGRLLQQQHFNGTLTAYTYDRANRLIVLTHSRNGSVVIASYTYTYDKNGNRLSMTDHTGGRSTYVYDADNRLIRVNYASGTTEAYTFDGAGNRQSLIKNGTATNYNYDAADRLQTEGNASYTFDKSGNLISKTQAGQITRYAYDGENRLVEVQLPDGKKVQYQYDPFGNRISQSADGATTRYFHDGDNVLMELDGNNQVMARYTAALNLDSWISMERNGQSLAYHTDGLGSVTALTGGNQALQATYTYDAYGQVIAKTGTVINPYTYTGRERDTLTGLYYYRTRYYDSNVGRFLTKDGFPGETSRPLSQNKFIYVEGNPIINVDPTGEFIPIIIGVVGGVAIDLFIQYLEHGSNIKCYNYYDLAWGALSGALGIGIVKNFINFRRLKYTLGTRKKILDDILEKAKPGSLDYIKHQPEIVIKEKFYSEILYKYSIEKAKLSASFIAGITSLVEMYNYRRLPDSPVCEKDYASGAQQIIEIIGKIPDIIIDIIRSFDPNEIIAPAGYGPDKYVSVNATLPYTILFENDPKFASAPAQRVTIEHKFDNDLNPFTFRLGSFGFGKYFFEVPTNTSYFSRRLDLRDSMGIYVDVIAGVDVAQNRAFWIFESIDPQTGFSSSLPATAGFLPVNDSLRQNGEGFVNFTIQPKSSAKTGDVIDAKAAIVFDDNPPIATNTAFNTIDADRPQSRIVKIEQQGAVYNLRWEGSDKGAGLADYTLYVSTNKRPFLPRVLNLDTTAYTFRGSRDSSYQFFTLSRDQVGNLELLKYSGEPACLSATLENLRNASTGASNGGASVKITGSSSGLSYTWSHDPALQGASATNLPVGVHTVTVRDPGGCTVALSFEIGVLVGVEDPQANRGLILQRLYPSPTREQLTVEFIAPESLALIEIYDARGSLLSRQNINALPDQLSNALIDVRSFAAGLYTLRLSTRKGVQVSGMFVKVE